MPFRFEELVSAKGLAYVRVHVSGEIGVADAREYVGKFGAGGPYHRKHTLSYVEKGTEYGAEPRKMFLAMGLHAPHATVTSSALVRAGINLMTRFSLKGAKYRMFAAEPEAIAWLEGQEI